MTDRIARLQQTLAAREIDLAIFTANADIYYLSGSVQPLYLLVPRVGAPFLLARKAIGRIAEESRLPVHAFVGTKDLLAILDATGVRGARRVGYTLDTTAFATVERLRGLFPEAETADVSWEARALRMVKDADEIAIFRRAAGVMAELPARLRRLFRPGMTELELSAALEYEHRLAGHDSLIRLRREGTEMSAHGVVNAGGRTLAGTKFEGICGGTGLSPAVPYGATRTPIAPGEPIVVDIAFQMEGYHLDQTRLACWGEPSAEVAAAYAAMLEIEATVLQAMRPGALWQDVFALSAEMAAAHGYADVYMGSGHDQVRFVGHGVGLELDEPPFLAPKMPYPLEPGMVIAIEPKVALPGVGVVGIEDTVLVTETGVESITTCAREIVVL
jgi:Xaa-Pro aminopeptidase